jgi:hypothetical protein
MIARSTIARCVQLGDLSALGKVFFNICQRIWTGEQIPESLRTPFIVSIFKSGDKTLPTSYRGISLVDSIMKVIASIVSKRIQTASQQRLSSFQAGFRPGEEGMGQVATLLEACQRRSIDILAA